MGGNVGTEGGAVGDITGRLGLARGVLQSLCDIWSAKDLSKATKICVDETLVLSVLLYNTETWCLTATQAKRLKVFEMACLRKIEGVTRIDRIRNEDIYRRVGIKQDILSRIQQCRLCYFGHISRMQDNRYPKIALHGRIQGQWCRGRPKKRWIDTIRNDCEEMNMNI